MLQNRKIFLPLQSQINMVPIVQLVRMSDCGSEGRGFEPHLAPQKNIMQEVNFYRLPLIFLI